MFWTSGWSYAGGRRVISSVVRIMLGLGIFYIKVFSGSIACGRCSCCRLQSGFLTVSWFLAWRLKLIGTFVNCQLTAISSCATIQELIFIIPFSCLAPPQYDNSALSSTYSPPAGTCALSWSLTFYYDKGQIPPKTHARTLGCFLIPLKPFLGESRLVIFITIP
jgi:hypothetical protein